MFGASNYKWVISQKKLVRYITYFTNKNQFVKLEFFSQLSYHKSAINPIKPTFSYGFQTALRSVRPWETGASLVAAARGHLVEGFGGAEGRALHSSATPRRQGATAAGHMGGQGVAWRCRGPWEEMKKTQGKTHGKVDCVGLCWMMTQRF
jgi:hypothetical protein